MFYFTLPLGPRSSVKLTEGLDGRQKKASNGILISSDHLEGGEGGEGGEGE